MALIKWTPFPYLEPIDDMEKFFDNWTGVSAGFTPAIDVYQDSDNVIVEAPLAGVDPKKVDISIENGVLAIKGESEKKSEVDDKNYYRKEVRYGSFYRAVQLPTKVNGDEAQASYEKGVLTIRIPKSPEVKPKSIKVQIKE